MAHRSKHQWHGRDRLLTQALKLLWLADAFAIPVGMGAFYHRLRRNPNRPVGGLVLQGSSFRRRQDTTQVQIKRLLKQQPDGRAPTHAVTTPAVNALQLIWRQAYMGWIA
jgi:hypothetical protein